MLGFEKMSLLAKHLLCTRWFNRLPLTLSQKHMPSRVTRLDECSPITFGSFLKIKEVAICNWATVKVMYATKNGLGYILGDFFKSSSGHPDARVHLLIFFSSLVMLAQHFEIGRTLETEIFQTCLLHLR
jgi:hypothetical protein